MRSNNSVVLIRNKDYNEDHYRFVEEVQIGYILSVFSQNKVQAIVYDLALTEISTKELADRVKDIAPILIVFVIEQSTVNPYFTGKMIETLRLDFGMSGHVAIYGAVYGEVAVGPDNFLNTFPIDSVVIGEEYDLLGLVSALSAGQSLETVSGIIYRGEDGAIKHNPPSALKIDLDSMPFPERYFLESPMVGVDTENYVAAILGSRGCYAKCNFCSLQAFDQFYKSYNWRGRSPKNIVDEMEYLYKEHNVREFVFQDMNFFGPGRKGQQRVIEFSQELDGRGLEDIAFSLYTRANDVQRDTFELLKSVGLHTVFIGIESFCQSVLDRFDKGMKVEDNLKAIQILKDLDIYLRMGFITFDYYTTFNELKENVRVLKDVFSSKGNLILIPVFFHNIVAPLAGTPLGKQYELIGAGRDKSNVHYQFGNKLVEHQSRYSRFGQVTIFEDERIAYVSEAARILSGIAGEKLFLVQDQLSGYLFTDDENGQINLTKCLEWIEGLMSFVVKEFEIIINFVEKNNMQNFDEMIESVRLSFDNYDTECFSSPIPITNILWH